MPDLFAHAGLDAFRTITSALTLGIVVCLVWVATTRWPGLRLWPKPTAAGRVHSLDGLRGYLALGVVFSHSFSYHSYFQTGKWDWPTTHLFKYTGQVGVMVFFAMTGYLFWARAIKQKGSIPAIQHYYRRFWRIFPLYYALLAAVLCVGLVGSLKNGMGSFGPGMAVLLFPGWMPSFHMGGVNASLLLTQTWSLKWEVLFYFSLPIVAVFASDRRTNAFFLGSVAVASVALSQASASKGVMGIYVANFAVGMVAALFKATFPMERTMRSRTASTVSLVAFASIFFFEDAYNPWCLLLLLVAFVPLVFGNDLFGVLGWKPSKVLGDVSYSIYMVHLIVLAAYLRCLNLIVPVGAASEQCYAVIALVGVNLVIAASLATFKVLEEPFLAGMPEAWGRRLAGTRSARSCEKT